MSRSATAPPGRDERRGARRAISAPPNGRRQEWHLVACCPPNVMRLFASLGHYVATRDASGLQIHQFASARIVTELAPGRAVALRMESAYPWEGRVRLA